MNLKRIIREELEVNLGSFYLIVSEDEKWVYTKGHLGGYSWRKVEDLNPKEIINSDFKVWDDAEDVISRIKFAPPTSKPQGTKIVTIDFIIQKRDEKFPMTESEEDEWEWARETQPVELENPEDWIGRSFGYGQAIIDDMTDSEIFYGDDEEYFTILGIDENGNLPLVKYHPLRGENYDSSTSPHLLRRYISKGDWVWK
jgi:hypothetical protein